MDEKLRLVFEELGMKELQNNLRHLGKDLQQVYASSMKQDAFAQKQLNGYANGLVKSIKLTKESTKVTNGFKMEFLGLMFFGQMLSRTFLGMLKPAADMVGIFDLWTTTLQVFFLPIMIELMPFFIGIMDFFMNIPEPAKQFLGIFVLIVGGLGSLLSIVGSVVLGVGAIAGVFGVASAAVWAFALPVLAIIAVIALIITAIMNWEKITKAMSDLWHKFVEFLESTTWGTAIINIVKSIGNTIDEFIISPIKDALIKLGLLKQNTNGDYARNVKVDSNFFQNSARILSGVDTRQSINPSMVVPSLFRQPDPSGMGFETRQSSLGSSTIININGNGDEYISRKVEDVLKSNTSASNTKVNK